MTNPTARKDNIVVQEIFDELVIYDLERDKVHTLNPTAALVWQHCDGQHTSADLASLLRQKMGAAQAKNLLTLTLEGLHGAQLLENDTIPANGRPTISRRKLLKMAGVGLAMLPVVKTIVAPTAAQANSFTQSGAPSGSVAGCFTDGDCPPGLSCYLGQCT